MKLKLPTHIDIYECITKSRIDFTMEVTTMRNVERLNHFQALSLSCPRSLKVNGDRRVLGVLYKGNCSFSCFHMTIASSDKDIGQSCETYTFCLDIRYSDLTSGGEKGSRAWTRKEILLSLLRDRLIKRACRVTSFIFIANS